MYLMVRNAVPILQCDEFAQADFYTVRMSALADAVAGPGMFGIHPAQRLSPTNFEQKATMKDTSVREDPILLRVGVSRQQIAGALDAPNETSDQDGVLQDVYEFNPDGSKFVKRRFTRETSRPVSSLAVSRRLSTRAGFTTPKSS